MGNGTKENLVLMGQVMLDCLAMYLEQASSLLSRVAVCDGVFLRAKHRS